MKRMVSAVLLFIAVLAHGYAQECALCISHGGINDYVPLSLIDSICFDTASQMMFVQPSDGGTPFSFRRADISMMTFVQASAVPASIIVTYDGPNATVHNPFLFSGVTAEIREADVTVTNACTTTEYTVSLTGETAAGSFTYNGDYKVTIELDGVSITSTKGAAIDIECGKRVNLHVKKGTVNYLEDADGGAQKAALYCKGHLEIDKAGVLNVLGKGRHAISAKEYIKLKKSDGTLNILGAKGDGIHCGQYFLGNGYTVNISNVMGDGIQAEVQSLDDGEAYAEEYENGSLQIQDGTYSIAVTEDGGFEADTTPTETAKSYKVYVAKPAGNTGFGGNRGGNYWGNIYLYRSDGTLVQQLTNTVTLTSGTGQSLQFYVYDFRQADDASYYFMSDDYRSMGSSTLYTIKSEAFVAPQTGTDSFYQISSSYSTTGSTRMFSLSSVQEIYGGVGGTSVEGSTYSSSCLKAESSVVISGGVLELNNSGSMSKSIKSGNSETLGTVLITGGNVVCTTSGDMYLNGSEATYCTAIKTDYYIGMGGSVTIDATGGRAIHGISADDDVLISGGSYTIVNTSSGYTSSGNTYSAKAITCDKDILITGGNFNLKMSGTGGKCIKSDGELTIGKDAADGPIIVAATTGASLGGGTTSGGGRPGQPQSNTGSPSKAIKAIGQIVINGGNLTVTTTTDGAEGLESKTGILIRGGSHYLRCYDDCINSAGVINFAGGNSVCYATNNDAVDSNYGRSGAITLSGGNVFAYTSAGSPEEGLDCDNNAYIIITGGVAVSAGGSQGGGGSSSQSIGSSTQNYFLGSSPSSYSPSYYYTLYNTSGEAICTYKFESNVNNTLSLLTAPTLGKGSVSIKQGSATPSSCAAMVQDTSGNGVFFISPSIITTSSTASVSTK